MIRIHEDSVGIPEYYRWRSRSVCYFRFFQRRDEWLGLAKHHPDHFERAKSYEKTDPGTGRTFIWIREEPLDELVTRHAAKASPTSTDTSPNVTWKERIREQSDDPACLICTL